MLSSPTVLFVGEEGESYIDFECVLIEGVGIFFRKLSSALQVAPSHAGASTVVNVAKGQITGFVRVEIVAVSSQESSVEKHELLQLSRALVLAAQLMGTHRSPQMLVTAVWLHEMKDVWMDDDSVDVVDGMVVLLKVVLFGWEELLESSSVCVCLFDGLSMVSGSAF